MRVLLVWNPSCLSDSARPLWRKTVNELAAGCELETLETTSADDSARVGEAIRRHGAEVVAAGGGDGTMNLVLNGLMHAEPRPALALFAIGTANAFARTLGLPGIRRHGPAAADAAAGAVLRGRRRRIDIGRVGERYFGGSFAVGMDADILALRNLVRRRLGFGGRRGGYALYLLSCATNVFRPHGGGARFRFDGSEERRQLFNLLVTNLPMYAGEFRFDDVNHLDDGRLDAVPVDGVLEYLRVYPQAWRRHVHYQRGEPVSPPPRLRRVREIEIELPQPAAAQVDGEEIGPAATYQVSVVPAAIEVCVLDRTDRTDRTDPTDRT